MIDEKPGNLPLSWILKKEEITDINKQMKDLIRRRAELRKRNVARKSKTDEETLKEKPLTQRNPRTKPKVISDVRLVSPRAPVGKGRDIGLYRDVTLENNDSASADKTNEKWATVVNRKKLLEGNRNQDRDKFRTIPSKQSARKLDKEPSNNRGVNRRPPKSAAVLVTSNRENVTYADILKMARDNISLDELKIESTKIRRLQTEVC